MEKDDILLEEETKIEVEDLNLQGVIIKTYHIILRGENSLEFTLFKEIEAADDSEQVKFSRGKFVIENSVHNDFSLSTFVAEETDYPRMRKVSVLSDSKKLQHIYKHRKSMKLEEDEQWKHLVIKWTTGFESLKTAHVYCENYSLTFDMDDLRPLDDFEEFAPDRILK